MIQKFPPSEFIRQMARTPVIDVRSPGEFQLGHIPGARNLPLMENAERAEVGTLYKEKGRETAVLRGLEIIGPKMAEMVRMANEIAPGKEILIHCWRGGMRSGSMAWLLQTAGFQCSLLEGGYKAFRKTGKEQMATGPHRIYIIGGFTGSAKTHVLHALNKRGEQVLDIESHARHRGSSFGMIGQEPQHSNEHFENLLIFDWMRFDPGKRVWLEDESRILGSNRIPDELYERIRSATLFKLNVPLATRVQNLVKDYAHLDSKELEKAILRIERKLGGQHLKKALVALENKDFSQVAEIALHYYDKTYSYGLSKREEITLIPLPPEMIDPEEIAGEVIRRAETMERS